MTETYLYLNIELFSSKEKMKLLFDYLSDPSTFLPCLAEIIGINKDGNAILAFRDPPVLPIHVANGEIQTLPTSGYVLQSRDTLITMLENILKQF